MYNVKYVTLVSLAGRKPDEINMTSAQNECQIALGCCRRHNTTQQNRCHDSRVFPDQIQNPDMIPTMSTIRYLIINTMKSGTEFD